MEVELLVTIRMQYGDPCNVKLLASKLQRVFQRHLSRTVISIDFAPSDRLYSEPYGLETLYTSRPHYLCQCSFQLADWNCTHHYIAAPHYHGDAGAITSITT